MKAKADRQGDVSLVHTGKSHTAFLTPMTGNGAGQHDKRGRLVLAEGEVTGHAHVIEDANAFLAVDDNGQTLLVVQEAAIKTDQFLEGKVLGTMPGGTVRFQQTDGTVIRFNPSDIEMRGDVGVYVKRAFTPLKHDEHDAIPVSPGVYIVHQHQTIDAQRRRRIQGD